MADLTMNDLMEGLAAVDGTRTTKSGPHVRALMERYASMGRAGLWKVEEYATAMQQDACETDARDYLAKAACDSIYYVALGKCLRREMAEKYGLTEAHVEGLLSKAACKLVDEIRSLGT